eukprot:SAG11_NODE_14198_length_622_cov_0.588910_2_plen_98_part_01
MAFVQIRPLVKTHRSSWTEVGTVGEAASGMHSKVKGRCLRFCWAITDSVIFVKLEFVFNCPITSMYDLPLLAGEGIPDDREIKAPICMTRRFSCQGMV